MRRNVTERGRANAVDAIREPCDNAAREGVTIGLEVVNRYESNLLNTTEQALAFLDELGADNATVQLDTYHALCTWRETRDDGMELATSARQFLEEQRAMAAAA